MTKRFDRIDGRKIYMQSLESIMILQRLLGFEYKNFGLAYKTWDLRIKTLDWLLKTLD